MEGIGDNVHGAVDAHEVDSSLPPNGDLFMVHSGGEEAAISGIIQPERTSSAPTPSSQGAGSVDQYYPDLDFRDDMADSSCDLSRSSVFKSIFLQGSLKNQSKKFFFFDSPLQEETGAWIPLSVPPMTVHDREEWHKGFGLDGSYFPEVELPWDQLDEEDREMTMGDVFSQMIVAAKGTLQGLASFNLGSCGLLRSSSHLQEAWKQMAQSIEEANYGFVNDILEREPIKWLPDSVSRTCMLCNVRFHPILYPRHHCRFCGGLFCGDCSKGRSLLPPKFRTSEPQRVCDVCHVRLESVQPFLMNQVSRASQVPTHDLIDLSTLRSWLNFPWARTMEYEIYKAANTIRGVMKVGLLKSKKAIPDAILKQAKGLAILTAVKVGMMVTYQIGTGLVVARRVDGSWSPPSAISTFGIGWGAQGGGELTDFIIVLRNTDAVRTFSGNAHLSVGLGVSAAAGIIGRTAEADFRAGDQGYAACYSYSCSKGAFVGCALKGCMVTTRSSENARFYGSPVSGSDILLGSMPRPPAAAILYSALSEVF